ncbi:MAG TPA: helix-turn-helix domain-containing protein, partial [Microthrixaceae bacterium]|nr:helix-turn-helix domain-containing protein [Microthrixaceae bacterium]
MGDPTDEILATAGRLFAELGVAGTTMSRLASEVGLKQSSLYYYFRNRDEVVAALVSRANVVPL